MKTTVSDASECLIWKPIYWAVDDTAESIAQIKEHNAVWEDRCK